MSSTDRTSSTDRNSIPHLEQQVGETSAQYRARMAGMWAETAFVDCLSADGTDRAPVAGRMWAAAAQRAARLAGRARRAR